MTIHSHFREEQIQIARYRELERTVTDPLALCFLRIIVQELEADLQHARSSAPDRHGSRNSPGQTGESDTAQVDCCLAESAASATIAEPVDLTCGT